MLISCTGVRVELIVLRSFFEKSMQFGCAGRWRGLRRSLDIAGMLLPTLDAAVDSSGSGDFDDFTQQERDDRKMPCGRGCEVKPLSVPGSAEREDGKGGDGSGDDAVAETGGGDTNGAREHASSGSCQGVGEEVTSGGAEELCDYARGVRA